jgi:triosephosphate isomerase
MPNIDGGLVGGASLDPDSFSKIVNWDRWFLNVGILPT